MVETHTWHSGADWVGSKWPVPVSLLPDEILSSWLIRIALAQGCDPLVLTGELWPNWRMWTMDTDRYVSVERLSVLARKTGVSVLSLTRATLNPYISATISSPYDDRAIWPWTLSLGSRNRKRHGGLQYCSMCLANDAHPFYRIPWRMAWHTSCPEHLCFLLDKCPHCSAVIEPHRLTAPDCTVAICATCKKDLREVRTIPCDNDALSLQKAADQTVISGTGYFGSVPISCGEWFELVHYLTILLRKAARGTGINLRVFLTEFDIDSGSLISPATGLALELLPVDERSRLLACVSRIISQGAQQFLKAAVAVGLTQSALRDKRQLLPRPIADIIQDLPEIRYCTRAKNHSSAIRPRSRRAVIRMWSRLQRKMAAK